MADTHGSEPCARKGVEVQVLSPALFFISASGETGIHAALRWLWEQSRGGSSPLSRTASMPPLWAAFLLLLS